MTGHSEEPPPSISAYAECPRIFPPRSDSITPTPTITGDFASDLKTDRYLRSTVRVHSSGSFSGL